MMRIPNFGLKGTLLTGALLCSALIEGTSNVDVGLVSSFDAPPFLIELLETACDENATSYFPLLDRIADGYFENAGDDQSLYKKFSDVLLKDGHMDVETFSSFNLALSLRTTTPRVEAEYQYYRTSVEPYVQDDPVSCPVWISMGGNQYCTPMLDSSSALSKPINISNVRLPFDRAIGNLSAPASVLYADVQSPLFRHFHKTLMQSALEGKTHYTLRHRPTSKNEQRKVSLSGYGVELALKRTDYIVIDDRDADASAEKEVAAAATTVPTDEHVTDLKPLSRSELLGLGLKAASYIMQNEAPLDMLINVLQDFPRYSGAISSHNASENFILEHEHNRATMVPAGMNVLWINGRQIPDNQADAFRMLELLRKERQTIRRFESLGLTGAKTIDLLSHSMLTKSKSDDEPPRYDWRDDDEGGNAIIWLNDIEKDKRYQTWPDQLQYLLQRTYPGQLPQVRRNIFTLVLAVDLANIDDIELIVQQISSFVKRKLPLRFGLVPLTASEISSQQAQVVYNLLENRGITAVIAYLEAYYSTKGKVASLEANYKAATDSHKILKEKAIQTFEEATSNQHGKARVARARRWASRLQADSTVPPVFVDGVLIPRNDNWLQAMSLQINTDLQMMQQAVYEGSVKDEDWPPLLYLQGALPRRNPLIIPEDDSELNFIDVAALYNEYAELFKGMPYLKVLSSSGKQDWAQLLVAVSKFTVAGQKTLEAVVSFRKNHPEVEVILVDNPFPGFEPVEHTHSPDNADDIPCNNAMCHSVKQAALFDGLGKWESMGVDENNDEELLESYRRALNPEAQQQRLQQTIAFCDNLGLKSGEQAFILNGRLIGPMTDDRIITVDDLEQLLQFERAKRINPVMEALTDLGLLDILDSPNTSAKLTSMIATLAATDSAETIGHQISSLRIDAFKAWQSNYTAIEVGDVSSANIRIVAAVDPAAPSSQRLVPILKVLSELEGVHLKLFLNPKERLAEIPIKRFYRYVLDSKPTFNADGSRHNPSAVFTSVPQEALLTVGMDVPGPWLVAPKTAAQDLDNLKLSSVNGDVTAVYELENILIEGHSRDITHGVAPRGAQLVLGTTKNPHFADTIIMTNVGYFQFKANPGHYKVKLNEGRSSEIFKIKTLGAAFEQPGEDTSSGTGITLMSFQGVTLFPKLERNPGQETEDVLEVATSAKPELVSKGLKMAEDMAEKYLPTKFQNMLKKPKTSEHADINIFSVASGHLYERMLNIMMVSVMKHTKHTVKFWFIEQFLSPDFKANIQALSEAYNFEYEMVTYKWPHWLRQQTEKQREIWGYKILFLDVLFPLSLDKVIFVDADQIVRTDMKELVDLDLHGAPYGFTPMCDSRTEIEGFRFWKQGYWARFLKGMPYHISALFVVDLRRFRELAAGDRLRQQYHQLSADPGSLSNLDQDLPNHMQESLPIFSLPQDWLWCETWCADEGLERAKTIDLCNNPMTKEPKLDRARRQVPEWTVYDEEITDVLAKTKKGGLVGGKVVEGHTKDEL